MSDAPNNDSISAFISAPTVAQKWEAARILMAGRKLQHAAQNPEFRASFKKLGEAAIEKRGLERSLAIALIVRISELLKGETKQDAARYLTESLTVPPGQFWEIAEKKSLTVEAKPAEIRENIALALEYARGDWVFGYAMEALAREDRSQRCRLELCRQVSKRNSDVAVWLEWLAGFPWSSELRLTPNDAAARTRDIADALAATVRVNRAKIVASSSSGALLAKWADRAVAVSPHADRPKALALAATSIIALLDEIIAAEFTLIEDAETYAVLGPIHRWWQNRRYPDDVESALEGIVRKLSSAIILLARKGQRSEALASRLQQALGSRELVRTKLAQIAESEAGLSDGIDDWLRGRERRETSTSAALSRILAGSNSTDAAAQIAPLLLDIAEGAEALQNADPQVSTSLRRIQNRANAVALSFGLEIVGSPGEIVEYNPNLHRTNDDSIPPEPAVKILRPMVVRNRGDGSKDVLERAIVAAA